MLVEADFALVSREVKQRSGAVLTRDMIRIAEGKLTPLSRREGFASVSELINAAKTRADAKLWSQIADALAQSETRFFRDRAGFARLKSDILPALARGKEGPLRIWSAGCSTGQEAYSLAMIADELREQGIGVELTASDMSTRLIDKARAGLFTQFEVQRGLPIRKLIAYFEKTGDLWRISDRLRASVRFEIHNLLEHPADLGQFDAILCCNVLSGFDAPTRAATFERLCDALSGDGVLMLGAGETYPEAAEVFSAAGGAMFTKQTARKAA